MRYDLDPEFTARETLAFHALHDRGGSCPELSQAAEQRNQRFARVRVERRFDAPPERVFAAWLDAKSAGRWLFATSFHPITEVHIDARVGGRFRFLEHRRRSSTEYAGRYLAIMASRRLAFTLALDGGPASTVTIGIAPRRKGCELVLLHQPVASRERQRIEGRWMGILYGLELMLEAEISHIPTRR